MPQIPLKYLALRVQMHLWFLVFPVVKMGGRVFIYGALLS